MCTASRPASTRTCTRRRGSWRLPYAMALASASASAVRRLKRTRRGDRTPLLNRSAISSTAGPTYPRSLGTSSASSKSDSPPVAEGRTSRRSCFVTLEGGERLRGGLRDREQGIQLGELEQRLQVLVQARQT